MKLKTTLLLISAVGLMTAANAAVAPTKPKPAAAKPAASVSSGTKTWALLVGISKYQSTQIASLNYPASDVTAVAADLEDPKLGNVPKDHILLLTNEQATRDAIMGAVDTFLKPGVKPGDKIIIFLAGHGVAKGVGLQAKGYLLPYDVRGLTIPALDASAVNLKDLASAIAKLPASQFVAFVDACREDPTPGRGVAGNALTDVVTDSMSIHPVDETKPISAVTLFACSIGQRAYEDPKFMHGVFTHYILESIETDPVVNKADGSIDMGVLDSNVTEKVVGWAKQQSSTGDFEVDQTPQPESPGDALNSPIMLMTVRRPADGDPIVPAPSTITIDAPDNAKILVDNAQVGSGTVQDVLSNGGTHTISAQLPGQAPVTKTVTTFLGYNELVDVNQPLMSRGLTAANDPQNAAVPDTYTKAQGFEQKGQYDPAIAGYGLTITAHPDFAPAYESLALLQRRETFIADYVGTLVNMLGQTPVSAHALSLLATAYAQYATQGPGSTPATDAGTKAGKDYAYPKSQKEAAQLAVKAANAAVAMDPGLAEAQRALGFALISSDNFGKVKNQAVAGKAMGTAIFIDATDPVNDYADGYCKRFYAQQIKDDGQKKVILQQAIDDQNAAIKIRQNYYEAHRELAYCYTLLNDRPNAEKEYTTANSYLSQATDGNEVAGTDVAMSALYKQDAQNTSDPQKKQDYMSASDGELANAKGITPDLSQAMGVLRSAGLSTSLSSYLPSNLQNMLGNVNSITSHIPGGFHVPGF